MVRPLKTVSKADAILHILRSRFPGLGLVGIEFEVLRDSSAELAKELAKEVDQGYALAFELGLHNSRLPISNPAPSGALAYALSELQKVAGKSVQIICCDNRPATYVERDLRAVFRLPYGKGKGQVRKHGADYSKRLRLVTVMRKFTRMADKKLAESAKVTLGRSGRDGFGPTVVSNENFIRLRRECLAGAIVGLLLNRKLHTDPTGPNTPSAAFAAEKANIKTWILAENQAAARDICRSVKQYVRLLRG